MSRPFIFADQLTNLTDARYFAAMGIDYISFNLSPSQPGFVSAGFVKQIGDWLSGPEIIGNFNAFEKDDFITKMIEECTLKGVCLEAFGEHNFINDFPKFPTFIRLNTEIARQVNVEENSRIILSFQKLEEAVAIKKEILSEHQVFLDGPIYPEMIDLALFSNFHGIVIKGGEEEKIGYKSFDQLDEIFEKIEGMSF